LAIVEALFLQFPDLGQAPIPPVDNLISIFHTDLDKKSQSTDRCRPSHQMPYWSGMADEPAHHRGIISMLFFIYRIDRSGTGDLRTKTRPAHLEYAATLGDRLVYAGPTLNDDGDMIASVWVVDAADRAEAEAITAADPYEQVDLFESKTVQRFMQVVPAP
jgi:uncharacterized protein YciI